MLGWNRPADPCYKHYPLFPGTAVKDFLRVTNARATMDDWQPGKERIVETATFRSLPGPARAGSQLLCSLFRDQRGRGLLRLKFSNPHFLPVVAEFPAAIQADHVSPGAYSGGSAAQTGAHRDGKTITGVPATKHRVHHLRKHCITSSPETMVKTSLGSLACFG